MGPLGEDAHCYKVGPVTRSSADWNLKSIF